MRRRTFLKVTGMAGILAAHRAPAFAQGTKLHILRWNDFIPACDVELKKQALHETGITNPLRILSDGADVIA